MARRRTPHSPVAVPGLTHIVSISAGIDHACALAADGTIWCWGLNLNGELGHAPTDDSCKGAVCSMTPVRVDWSTDSDGGLDTSFPPARDAAQESLPSSADGGVPVGSARICANVGGTFCQKDSCDPSVIGVCAVIPGTRNTGFCQAEVNFVCGCDGNTYEYPCLAHAESVNIASQGPVPASRRRSLLRDQLGLRNRAVLQEGILRGGDRSMYRRAGFHGLFPRIEGRWPVGLRLRSPDLP